MSHAFVEPVAKKRTIITGGVQPFKLSHIQIASTDQSKKIEEFIIELRRTSSILEEIKYLLEEYFHQQGFNIQDRKIPDDQLAEIMDMLSKKFASTDGLIKKSSSSATA